MNNKIIAIPTGDNYSQWYNELFYADKTNIIKNLQGALKSGSALFFARPRRWGKSLFLSTLKYFFDENLFDEKYFIDKAVWTDKELRKRAGTYFTISLDLKPLYDVKTETIKLDNLYKEILKQIPEKYFKKVFEIDKPISDIGIKKISKELKEYYPNAGILLKTLTEEISEEKNIFIFIDEYDKPVNDSLKTHKNEPQAQKVLEDMKNELYRYLKDIPAVIIITGVNKLSMASFFSDFNNLADFSNMINVGFSQKETEDLFSRLDVKYNPELEKWYNGYYFSGKQEFNPWAITRFLKNKEFKAYWARTGLSPQYFKYLMQDVLQINNLEDFLKFLEDKIKFSDKIINLDYINNNNPDVIIHYFYYAGLLSVQPKTNKFFIPNNDVIESYESLMFTATETRFYRKLKTKLVDMLEKWPDKEKIKDFIIFMLNEKYNNLDKTSLNENIIVSDIALLIKTFSRNDVQREVNIFSGRTDLKFIDLNDKKNLVEFKIARKTSEIKKKKLEAQEQIKKYMSGGNYDLGIIVLIDLEKVGVEVF